MVYDQLPANVREMMNGSDNMFVRPSSVDANQLGFKRLQYLQDLYRFFELNTYRSEFRNPFWTGQDTTLTTQFFMHSAISLRVFYKEIVALMNFALKRKEWELLHRLIRRYQPSEAEVQHLCMPTASDCSVIIGCVMRCIIMNTMMLKPMKPAVRWWWWPSCGMKRGRGLSAN